MNRPAYAPLATAVVATLITSGLWFALAWRTPTSTYHFAPLIAGGIGPAVIRSTISSRAARAVAPILAASAAVVGTAIAGLAIFDRLRGPTFWAPDGALTESLLFAVIGLVVGTSYLLAPQHNQPTESPTHQNG